MHARHFAWRIAEFFRTNRVGDVIILSAILLAAASGWFDSGLPKGSDAFGSIPAAAAARDLLLQYHRLSGWTTHWYLGYPLYYMFPSLAHTFLWVLSVPLGWIAAMKTLYLAFFVLSAVFAFIFVYELTKSRPASFVASLFYAMAPFHLGEVVFEGHHVCFGMAYMLIPLVLWLTEKTITRPSVTLVIVGGLSMAALILTHPQMLPILVGPLWVLYVVFRVFVFHSSRARAWRSLIACGMAVSIGLLLTAYWWLPLLSETKNLNAEEYSLAGSTTYEASRTDAVTLCLTSGESAKWAYSRLPIGPIKLLRIFLLLFVLAGFCFNYRNKFVWFFAGVALISVLLSMGIDSPIDLFSFAYHYVPFFQHIRTPGRFLLVASLAYAILAGFGTKSLLAACSRRPALGPVIVAVLCLAVTANTWQEARDGFSTFHLTPDQQGATSWLADQESGRVMAIPPDTWVSPPQTRSILNPMIYTHITKLDTVSGGSPNVAPRWTGEFLDSLSREAKEHPVNVGAALDVMGVDYVVVDKTSSDQSNYILDKSCTLCWESDTIDVYWNQDAYPRVYTMSAVSPQMFTDSAEGTDLSTRFPGSGSGSAVQGVEYSLVYPGKYEVNINTAQPCWIVLDESYYHGWVATIDGQKIPSERIYGFLNAWPIESAGEHQITLEFVPSTLNKAGMLISALTLIGLLLFMIGRTLWANRPRESH